MNFRPTDAANARSLLTDPNAADEGWSSFARYFKTGEAFIFSLANIGGVEGILGNSWGQNSWGQSKVPE